MTKKKNIENGKYYIFHREIERNYNNKSELEMVLVLITNQKPKGITISREVGSIKLVRIPFSGRKFYETGGIVEVSNNGKTVDGLQVIEE